MKDKYDKMFEALKKGKLGPKTEEGDAYRIVITDVKTGKTLHDFKSNGFAAAIHMTSGRVASIAQSKGGATDVLGILFGLRKIQAAIEQEVPEELLALLPLVEMMNNDKD